MERKPLYLFLFWLFAAGVALLAAGGVAQRQIFLTRGIPSGLPEPMAHGGATLGLNVALEQYDEAALDATLTQLAATGVRYVKQSFYFAPPSAYDWENSDRLISAVSAHHLILIPLLDGHPADQFAPPDKTAFAAWVGEFASRYGNNLRYYIIWDEPNLMSHWGNQPPNPIEYGALLTSAANAIRGSDSDAVIVAAPLAPTVETGPQNLADWLFLQQLYLAGVADAFDVAAAKPYGFSQPPDDRTVDAAVLNFSHVILMREVMEQYGDGGKSIWAGNWGWNWLPEGWHGNPSVWGQAASERQQTEWTVAAYQRARLEWPWMGLMFLENWQPASPADDPRWGFAVAGRQTAVALSECLLGFSDSSVCHFCDSCLNDSAVASPGFHLAAPGETQIYQGGWEFSPQFGADISQTPENAPADRMTFTFWGSDVGVRVRRADFRARLYITIDGQPANALPRDENGSTLILTSPSKTDDYLATEWVARDLPPGVHTLELVAVRGWDQWALNGFSVAYHPPDRLYRLGMWGLVGTAVGCFFLVFWNGRKVNWQVVISWLREKFANWGEPKQMVITAVCSALVALTGWLTWFPTWAEPVAGVYRRLGDGSQLTVMGITAVIFYVAPSFFVYLPALLALFILIALRPAWGIALITFCLPFYVTPKPMMGYRFSPVEVFTLITFAAFLVSRFTFHISHFTSHVSRFRFRSSLLAPRPSLLAADYAVLAFVAVTTISLFFTTRLDVALNEWRWVILEPALLYVLLRGARLNQKEMWWVLDAFILGGAVVAVYGLWQYGTGSNLITAEGGLMRLRSVYGSPNNVALYLGRIIPLLVALVLPWPPNLQSPISTPRRRFYLLLLAPITLAVLFTFSKGALFLGLPSALLFVFWQWQRANGRSTWPWVVAAGVAGAAGLLVALQIPVLAGRLDLTGTTGLLRVNLWRASLNMVTDHPWFGVGLDNFLYEYRSRYIFDAAWAEPNLNHPHNLFLDFATRLGLLGLVTGGWMIGMAGKVIGKQLVGDSKQWAVDSKQWTVDNLPYALLPLVVGLGGVLVDMLVHGLVDHSFFLVDLAGAFYLLLGTAVLTSASPTAILKESVN